jgi:hypothetical protein
MNVTWDEEEEVIHQTFWKQKVSFLFGKKRKEKEIRSHSESNHSAFLAAASVAARRHTRARSGQGSPESAHGFLPRYRYENIHTHRYMYHILFDVEEEKSFFHVNKKRKKRKIFRFLR